MSTSGRLSWPVGLLMLLMMLVALGATATLSLRSFERELVPEIEQKTITLGRSVLGLISRAQAHDIALAELQGVDQLFREVIKDNKEIDLMVITDMQGRMLHSSRPIDALMIERLGQAMKQGDRMDGLNIVSLSIEDADTHYGTLHVGARTNFVQSILKENLLDVLVVVVVAFFLAFEIANFMASKASVSTDLVVSSRLGAVRAPLFLFLVAEDLSRTFIPTYAASLSVQGLTWDMQFVQGLPIMLFMLVVGLSQPLMGSYSERLGRRKMLLMGCIAGGLSHFGAAMAFSLYDLLAWRALAGLAWGVLFVAGQGYVLDHTDAGTRNRGLAFFVGVIMAASVCGPSMGGILAEGIGVRGTLIVAGALALCAAFLVWTRLPVGSTSTRRKPIHFADFVALASNKRFVVLLLTAAMPAKIILIGLCFYMVPLYVPTQGASTAMVGRLIMLYAVIMVLAVPLFARWSGAIAHRWRFVAGGMLVSGIGGVMPLVLPGVPAVAVMMVMLGVGQALSIAPQTAMVIAVCSSEIERLGEGVVLGIYRLVERLGNVFGPLFAAVLLHGLSFEQTFVAIGAFMLGSSMIFAIVFRHGKV
jgi:predicted MFS family arabinose efflux permease